MESRRIQPNQPQVMQTYYTAPTLLDSITPLILTYNEVPNLDRTLQKLTWAKQIIIIESYSEIQFKFAGRLPYLCKVMLCASRVN